MKEYSFSVDVDDDKGQPFGPVNKENMDLARFLIDFSCWLDTGESISKIEHLMILANPPQTVPPWQQDYPLDQTSSTEVPVDSFPLLPWDQSINADGKSVRMAFTAGTPGLTYAVSFTCTGAVSQRRREVDILLVIDLPLNPGMVSPGDLPDPEAAGPTIINVSTALPLGFTGRLYVENTSGAPIQITLPPSPSLGDIISPVDIARNFVTFPCTYKGSVADLIYADNTFLTTISGDDLSFEWAGDHWIVLTNRYGFIAAGSSP